MERKTRTETVSIIVPMYNAERYVGETVRSVAKQTYRDWELLLVDDCSADGTVEAAMAARRECPEDMRGKIKIIRLKHNAGAAGARNAGLKEAAGRYVAYLDADDIWRPEKLERQLAFVSEKRAAFSFTGYEFTDENGNGTGRVVRVPETLEYRQALRNTTIFTSTVLFDTERTGRDMLVMPSVKSEDTALWWSVLRRGFTAYGLDENLVSYRRAGGTLSSNKLEAVRRIWNLYRKTERLSVPYSLYNFFFWAVRAVKRRV